MGLGWEASSSVVFFRLLDPDEVPPAPDPEPFGFNQASSH